MTLHISPVLHIPPVPLRMFKLWSFLGMVGQVPLFPVSIWVEKVTSKSKPESHLGLQKLGPRAGNALVWMSLIVGQPMGIMMYYHDYVVDNFGRWGKAPDCGHVNYVLSSGTVKT